MRQGTSTGPDTSVADLEAIDPDTAAVSEEESQLETCRNMAGWGNDPASPIRVSGRTKRREVLEYHDRINSTTILGELFGQSKPQRLVRITLSTTPYSEPGQTEPAEGVDLEFLRRRGAFNLPSQPICLLKLYFELVHPYTPILERIPFLRAFTEGTYSTFVFQCILTSVMPYVSGELLSQMGLADRSKAQQFFYRKAQVLYDSEIETSQLCRLQGSMILTASHFAFVVDKDCRFWLINAVRLATQMGLHRKQIAGQLDRPSRKLFSRLFWVLFNKDIIMAVAGRTNVRRLNDLHCNVPELTEADWESENEDDLTRFKSFIPPVPHLHKSYLVQNTRLSQLCARFIEMFSLPDSNPSQQACEDWEIAIRTWRRDLPLELHLEDVAHWSNENVWILVLRAMSYRLECVFYRNLRNLGAGEDPDSKRGALQKQHNAMFELSAVLDRIMLQDLVSCCPLSVTTCASMVVAMHIESVLKLDSTNAKRQASQMQIHTGIAYLRASSEHWASVRGTLRMLEEIVNKTGLTLGGLGTPTFDLDSMSPFRQKHGQIPNSMAGGDGRICGVSGIVAGHPSPHVDPPPARSNSKSPAETQTYDIDFAYPPMMTDEDPEYWLNELLADNVPGIDSMLPWGDLT